MWWFGFSGRFYLQIWFKCMSYSNIWFLKIYKSLQICIQIHDLSKLIKTVDIMKLFSLCFCFPNNKCKLKALRNNQHSAFALKRSPWPYDTNFLESVSSITNISHIKEESSQPIYLSQDFCLSWIVYYWDIRVYMIK